MLRLQAENVMVALKRLKHARRILAQTHRIVPTPSGAVGHRVAESVVVGNICAPAWWHALHAVEVLLVQRQIWKRQVFATLKTASKMPGARLIAPGVSGPHGADVLPVAGWDRRNEVASSCKRPLMVENSVPGSFRTSRTARSNLAVPEIVPSVPGPAGAIVLTGALVTVSVSAMLAIQLLEEARPVEDPPWNYNLVARVRISSA